MCREKKKHMIGLQNWKNLGAIKEKIINEKKYKVRDVGLKGGMQQ